MAKIGRHLVVLEEMMDLFEQVISELLRYWIGTPKKMGKRVPVVAVWACVILVRVALGEFITSREFAMN